VELVVYGTDDALDGFLNGADAGAFLGDGDEEGGAAHCGNFDGKLSRVFLLPCSLCHPPEMNFEKKKRNE